MPSALHSLLEKVGLQRPKGLEYVAGTLPLDEAVIKGQYCRNIILPETFSVTSAEHFAKSDFSITGVLRGVLEDGSQSAFFVKYAAGAEGKTMLEGEYASLRAIENAAPNLVPRIHGVGKFFQSINELEIHFLVEDFLEMLDQAPDPQVFAVRVAKMHKAGRSPSGKFGFPVTTCDGPLPHPVAWQDSWVAFFSDLLRSRVRMDADACGSWPALERASEQMIASVIPRLLGSLSHQGEPIVPSLIHGDLWDANVGTLQNGQPIIYDAACYYAHNEMELGIWRVIYAKNLGRSAYLDAYLAVYPAAEPSSEFDDRNRLYSLKCNLNWSATDPGIATRRIAYNDMCYLCERYAPLDSIDSYDPALDPLGSCSSLSVDR